MTAATPNPRETREPQASPASVVMLRAHRLRHHVPAISHDARIHEMLVQVVDVFDDSTL